MTGRYLPKSQAPAYAIFGPVACQSCHKPVWWAHSITTIDGRWAKGLAGWRERTGRRHLHRDTPERPLSVVPGPAEDEGRYARLVALAATPEPAE